MRMHLSSLTKRHRTIRKKLRDDLLHYAFNCLRIRTKVGSIQQLAFNRAQKHIHRRLEEQKAWLGRVRALILKGRQQGCSTYVGARFYHKTTHTKGLRTLLLPPEPAAPQNLFET